MRLSRTFRCVLGLAWMLLVLYPNPLVLQHSVRNLRHIEADPTAVAGVARTLPDSPRTIERLVQQELVPYSYDWSTDGVPWYFPTTAEVLRRGAGDCESRAVVLASILAAKGIPYELKMSIDHIWVDYPGKVPNALENDALAIGSSADGSSFGLHWPESLNVWREIDAQLGLFWTPMPAARKLLLLAGLLMLSSWNALALRRRQSARGPLVLAPLARTRRLPCTGRLSCRVAERVCS